MGAVTSVAIRQPVDDTKNHTVVLKQLKEAAETASRQRGNPQNSYAQVQEIISGGQFTLVNGTLVPVPPSTTGWGVPTGGAVQPSYNGASATLAQTSAAVAQIIAVLIARGFLGK